MQLARGTGGLREVELSPGASESRPRLYAVYNLENLRNHGCSGLPVALRDNCRKKKSKKKSTKGQKSEKPKLLI